MLNKTTQMRLAAMAVLVAAFGGCKGIDCASPAAPVGKAGAGRYITPTQQVLTPAGVQKDLIGMRPQAVALSPDGRMLVASGKRSELVVLDPVMGAIRQRVGLPDSGMRAEGDVSPRLLKPGAGGQLSYTGLIFSPDGKRIYLSNVDGDIKVFGVGPDGKVVAQNSIGLPAANAPGREADIPAGLDWAGFGNLFLVDKPAMMPVQVSRSVSPQELAEHKAEALEQAGRGSVMVSPFISPGEKEIAHAIMDEEYGSLVLVKADGFPPLYKPPGKYFDLCAQGRLLVLSPFVSTGRKETLTRQRCLQMNRWVAEMCAGMCANNGAPRQPCAAIIDRKQEAN